MKYFVFFLQILNSIIVCGIPLDSIYFFNCSESVVHYSYFDGLHQFKTLDLKPNQGKSLPFLDELLISSSKGGQKNTRKYLITHNDTIIVSNEFDLAYKNKTESLAILNKIAESYPSLDADNVRDFGFSNFVSDNSLEDIYKKLYSQVQTQDSILLMDADLHENQIIALRRHYKYQFINNYITAIIRKKPSKLIVQNLAREFYKEFQNDDNINSVSYRRALLSYASLLESAHDVTDKAISLTDSFDLLNGLSKDFVLFHRTLVSLNKNSELFIESYKKNSTKIHSPGYVDYLNSIYVTQVDNKTGEGKIIAISNDETVTIKDVLNRCQGNYVIFDFSASWCAPCIEAFPDILALEKSRENVVVIFISIDKDINQWKTCVKENNLPIDRSYFLVGGINSAFGKTYDIKSIPRYFIYDKNGDLIDQNAPSPKNDALGMTLK